MIAAGEGSGQGFAGGKGDAEVFVAAEGVVGGDDDAGFPEEAARWDAGASVDGGDELSGGGGGGCQAVGKGGEGSLHLVSCFYGRLGAGVAASDVGGGGTWRKV